MNLILNYQHWCDADLVQLEGKDLYRTSIDLLFNDFILVENDLSVLQCVVERRRDKIFDVF